MLYWIILFHPAFLRPYIKPSLGALGKVPSGAGSTSGSSPLSTTLTMMSGPTINFSPVGKLSHRAEIRTVLWSPALKPSVKKV